MRTCGAKTKAGGICKQAALSNGRCHYHGGKSLAGIASPTYKDGRYSKVMPTRLRPRYEEAQQDGALLELREDVALVDARLSDILSRVDTGESGALWRRLMAARDELMERRKADDMLGQIGAMNLILELISKGHADYQAWREVGAVLDQRRKLVESERKRLVEMQQTLSVEKAMLLIGAIGGIIKAHVNDRTVLTKISADISSLVATEPS